MPLLILSTKSILIVAIGSAIFGSAPITGRAYDTDYYQQAEKRYGSNYYNNNDYAYEDYDARSSQNQGIQPYQQQSSDYISEGTTAIDREDAEALRRQDLALLGSLWPVPVAALAIGLLFREEIRSLLERLNNLIVGCKDEEPETKVSATCPKAEIDKLTCEKLKDSCDKKWSEIVDDLKGMTPTVTGCFTKTPSGKVEDECQETCNNCGSIIPG